MHHLKDRYKQWKADTQSRKSNDSKSKSSENSTTNTKPDQNNNQIGHEDNPPNLSILSSQDFPQDLWQCAYEKLGQEDPNALSILDNNKKHMHTSSLQTKTSSKVEEVIQVTEDRYKKYQQGAWRFQSSTGKEFVPRGIAKEIFNAAYSFKDVIGAGVGLDPTQHAASAWAVVSLALNVSHAHWHYLLKKKRLTMTDLEQLSYHR